MVLNDDNHKNRRFVERCYRTRSVMVNPIVDWTDNDVWEFLHHYGCEGNPLYQEGFTRIGCIGCPLSGSKHQKIEFARWPKYKEMYIKTFDKMVARRKERGMPTTWNTGEEVMAWWLGDNPDQITLEDYYGDMEDV